MSQGKRKILAVLTIFLTALGIIFSLFLMIQVWRYRLPATEKLQSGVDQFSTTLQISDEGLVVIQQVVNNVYTSTTYLDEATNALSDTVQSTSQFMDTADSFVGDNLMTTITNTQTALGSAQASAKVVDDILGALSRIPLIGLTYNPSVPLNVALGDISSSLDPLQITLKSFHTNLQTTRTNMQVFSRQITVLNNSILDMQKNLTQAKTTIAGYRAQIQSTQAWLSDARSNLPLWITTTAWVITLIIVWLIVIQVAMMLQGFAAITSNPQAQDTLDKKA